MSTTSTAPTVRATLVAALDARPALDAVSVTHMWQGQADEQEAMFLGNTTITNEWATIRAGRKTRDETYQIQLMIHVHVPGDWGPAAETRMFVLIAEVEDLVAADPTLGLSATLPTLRVLVATSEVRPIVLDAGGIGAEATLTLEAKCRLS